MKNNTLALLTLLVEEQTTQAEDTAKLCGHYNDKKERTMTDARITVSDHIDNMITSLRKLQQDITKLPMETLMVKYPVLLEIED